jgi:GDPmannose 4,6-dehydratase
MDQVKTMNKKAIITGCHGQDGSYLSEFLLEKGYDVYGISRRTSSRDNNYLDNCLKNERFYLVNLDITDASGVSNIVAKIRPDEYYNLAAMSHVGQSFKEPLNTLKIDGEAVTIALEAIRNNSPETRFYQASTSELFGNSIAPQSEKTEFAPRSPYAAAKLYAHKMVGLYREAYKMHASCGILFNHESPRRGLDFVTRKITRGVAKFIFTKEKFSIGNLDAKRDWGHAKEYVEVMWKMLQKDTPEDYVIGTGETASIRDAIEYVCWLANVKEKPYYQDESMIRPAEVFELTANPEKAEFGLGWRAQNNWKKVLEDMFASDYKEIKELYDSNCSV